MTRSILASTSAPDLAARNQTTFYRDFSDFNPEAANLWDAAAQREDFNRRMTAWMLFKLGYRSPDARRLQVELAKVLGVSKVTICHYEGHFCKPRPVIQERLRMACNLNGDFDRFL